MNDETEKFEVTGDAHSGEAIHKETHTSTDTSITKETPDESKNTDNKVTKGQTLESEHQRRKDIAITNKMGGGVTHVNTPQVDLGANMHTGLEGDLSEKQ